MATTIENYLNGLFAEDFSTRNMTSVLLKRSITAGVDESTVELKSKELAQADLYMVLFNKFSKGSESVTKGNWKRSTGGVNIGVNDRKSFFDAANLIYKKYGESIYYGMKDGTNLW
jgi:hypothetical protein